MKFIFLLLLIGLFSGCNTTPEKAKPASPTESLAAEKDSLIRLQNQLELTVDSLQKRNEQLKKEPDVWFSNKTDGKQLLELGIENPEEYITNALRQKPELIPLKPVLGGEMRFMHVKLLGKGCLIAYYEDGHINGKALYSYKLGSDGLNFKLIRTCPE